MCYPLSHLFGPPTRPEVCWSGSSKKLCEELILTGDAQHDQDINQGSFDPNQSTPAIELSCQT